MNEIFSSHRFWLIVVTAVLQILAVLNILGGEQVDQIINILSVALVGIVAIRTVDRNAELKATATTVSMPPNVTSVTASKKKK